MKSHSSPLQNDDFHRFFTNCEKTNAVRFFPSCRVDAVFFTLPARMQPHIRPWPAFAGKTKIRLSQNVWWQTKKNKQTKKKQKKTKNNNKQSFGHGLWKVCFFLFLFFFVFFCFFCSAWPSRATIVLLSLTLARHYCLLSLTLARHCCIRARARSRGKQKYVKPTCAMINALHTSHKTQTKQKKQKLMTKL